MLINIKHIISIIIEALCVGTYTTLIYSIIHIRNEYSQLLIIGFCKHFFPRFLGIHKAYCEYNRGKNC